MVASIASIVPPAYLQLVDSNGQPLAGANVSYFIPGTTTLSTVYSDSGGTIPAANPVVLDSSGRALVYGTGDYQMQVLDELGDLVYSAVTKTPLPASSVSAFMLPVLGSGSAATFLNLSGVATYVSNAINNIQLLAGPAGATGAASTVPGPQGPQGPAGAAASSSYLNGNPAYWHDTGSGFTMQGGTSVTNSGGAQTVNFARVFLNTWSVVATTYGNPVNMTIRVQSMTTTGFTVYSEDTSQNSRSTSFTWLALGFS
jgi:hypothetical protein